MTSIITMTDTYDLGPFPRYITGGCLCGKIAYRIDFPEGHDFKQASNTCQCTQCRKNTSSLFFMWQRVPYASLTWTTPLDALKNFYCTPQRARGFCMNCGTFLYWRDETGPNVCVAIGTVNPLYLFGEGREEGGEVPPGGFGRALASGCGVHGWTRNEIPGVTDNLPLLGVDGRGERFETE
ncbi:hypothetical protein VTJ49DRAFT_4633 [Mycothermus thermophilus]|uniref:CENP-V/GFA domain-containing protein n=1 Tax=Humicola insolens TaxID=85995 RepID=A0ABR3V4X8_HUMIN